MRKIKHLVEFMEAPESGYSPTEFKEYKADVVARLWAYDKFTCSRKSDGVETKDLIEYIKDNSECICGGRVVNEEYNEEIAMRLKEHDEMVAGIESS